MTDLLESLGLARWFTRPLTVSEIQAAREAKDVGTLLKGLRLKDPDVNRAAAAGLDTVRESLGAPHLAVLTRILERAAVPAAPGDPDAVTRSLAEAIDGIRSRGWRAVVQGLQADEVVRLLGKPDFTGTGRDFAAAFNVGIIFHLGDAEAFGLPHWVWRSVGNPRCWKLVVFQANRVINTQSYEGRAR